MPDWSIIKHNDLWQLTQRKKKSARLDADKIPFEFTTTLPSKDFKKLIADPLLKEKIQKPCEKLFTKMVDEIARAAQDFDRLVVTLRNQITTKGCLKSIKHLQTVPRDLREKIEDLIPVIQKMQPMMIKENMLDLSLDFVADYTPLVLVYNKCG